MIIGTMMYSLWCWCTVYLSGGWGHLDWHVLRAPQYVNPALIIPDNRVDS